MTGADSDLPKSLRPPHFSAIAHFTQLHFDSGTVSERTEICRFVASRQLPQMLSWSSIIDAMYAQELDQYVSRLVSGVQSTVLNSICMLDERVE